MTTKEIKSLLQVDMVSKKRNGNFIIRKGYFYTNNFSEGKLKAKVEMLIPSATVVECGNHWTAFKGNAPLQKSSHWWVEFQIPLRRLTTEFEVRDAL